MSKDNKILTIKMIKNKKRFQNNKAKKSMFKQNKKIT